jgi:hypothetical protein
MGKSVRNNPDEDEDGGEVRDRLHQRSLGRKLKYGERDWRARDSGDGGDGLERSERRGGRSER